jgi:cobalamin biosynthetic protein CobC
MDSMIGHRTNRYEGFGKVATRLDDLVNLIPAWLTGLAVALTIGINRLAYVLPDLPLRAWAALRMSEDIANREAVVARTCGCTGSVMAFAGAQAAIQLVPRLSTAGRAAVLAPSCNEHAIALTAQR